MGLAPRTAYEGRGNMRHEPAHFVGRTPAWVGLKVHANLIWEQEVENLAPQAVQNCGPCNFRT